jgi:hypothetical protein
VPMRPLSAGYGTSNVPPLTADALDRKFAAADVDGDGYVDASEAADFVRYHERADLDSDGTISMEEMVQWLRPMEAQLYGAREEQQRGLAEVQAQQEQLQSEIVRAESELRALGYITDAEGTNRSSYCTVM